jgi:hypothetical protein
MEDTNVQAQVARAIEVTECYKFINRLKEFAKELDNSDNSIVMEGANGNWGYISQEFTTLMRKGIADGLAAEEAKLLALVSE